MSGPSPAASERRGRIVTFYSYKGGTGRSMALANVAWILASQGERVLVIDWDLEAPGLHRYFHPYMPDPELTSSPGIIDFLTAFVEGAHQAEPGGEGSWFEPYTDLEPYMFSLDWEFPGEGTLDMVPAGQQGPAYAGRVQGFDWPGFYERLGGGIFLEAVKRNLRLEYDWVLVDSRTGISDTSGICTVQLPDDLVVCFTLNEQSMAGAAAVTRSVVAQRTRPDGAPGLRVFPVRTRVERAEAARLNTAKESALRTFAPFLAHLPESLRDSYWGSMEVLYHPFYAYEEVLATFADPPQESGSMLSAMETLAAHLTDGKVTRLGAIEEERRLKEKDRFLRQPAAPPEPARPEPVREAEPPPERGSAIHGSGRGGGWEYLAYLSYAHTSGDAYLARFVDDLRNGLRVYSGWPHEPLFFDQGIDPGREWSWELRHAIETSRVCVALYSPSYFQSEHCGREFAAFRERSRLGGESPSIFPIQWVPARTLPRAAAETPLLESSFPVEYGQRGLRSLMFSRGGREHYRRIVDELARGIVDLALSTSGQPMTLPPLETLPSAFADMEAPAARGPSVQVVYAAGDRETMRSIRRDVELYGKDPREWRPFGHTPIGALAEQTAKEEKLAVEVVPFTSDLLHDALEAERNGIPFAVLVDPWIFAVPSLADRLRGLDERFPGNTAVCVLWDSTHETEAERADLQSRVQKGLPFLESTHSRRYQPRIDSEKAFRRSFASTMVSVMAELQAMPEVFSSARPSTLSEAG